jgi:4-diphosphocytidyl-2-C-methyl-D-erythritol kinase
MYNVFEDVLPDRKKGEIDAIKSVLIGHGALGAVMSGSGPTVFGIFSAREQAEEAWKDLKAEYRQTYLAKSV